MKNSEKLIKTTQILKEKSNIGNFLNNKAQLDFADFLIVKYNYTLLGKY